MTAALIVFNNPKANLRISFDPDAKFLSIIGKSDKNKHFFAEVVNHLQTMLPTSDLKMTNTSATMKVGENTDLSALQGTLRTKGFTGGESMDDATSLATENEEENTQDQQQNQPQSAPQPQNIQQQEGLSLKLFNMLFEGTYRTAEYWNDLFPYSGKGSKGQIEEGDILKVRKMFARKPKSKTRDKVLRATDKAAKYFIKKIRNTQGEPAAASWKEQYKLIGGVESSDYSEKSSTSPMELEPEPQAAPATTMKLSDMFDTDHSYDDIDIER